MTTGVGAVPAPAFHPQAGMIRYADVGPQYIVFTYAKDLWMVPRAGGTAIPIATRPAREYWPKFSPDGKTIAFSANYDGNIDIYTMPVTGGVPLRVTYHPQQEQVHGWTPDGRIIYSGAGFAGMAQQDQLFTVAPTGGPSQKLPVPYGFDGAISADGQWLAFVPQGSDFASWKRYVGGTATDIWLYNLRTGASKRMTDWAGSDTAPMWHGDTVYYLSDMGPEHRLNIWAYAMSGGKKRQVTHFTDYDVKFPSIGPGDGGKGEIVFQSASGLYLLDLGTEQARKVEVLIPGDRPTIAPRDVDASQYVQWGDLSPIGARVVVEARGDLWTLPAKNGSPRNLSHTSGVAERRPSWSPDGRWLAYWSDATGEYDLYLTQSDGQGDTKQLTHQGFPFSSHPQWSPDSKHLAFANRTGAMYLVDVPSGAVKLIDTDPSPGGDDDLQLSWSSDSRWIAYDRAGDTVTRSIWVYDTQSGQTRRATSGMFHDTQPTFDRKGDYLYFASTRSFQPTRGDLGADTLFVGTQVLVAVPLRADMKSPFAPKSDEETWEKEKPKEAAPASAPAAAPATGDDGLSGTWQGTAKGPGMPGEAPFSFSFQLAADGTVSGTVTTPGGTGTITSGHFDRATGALTMTVHDTDGLDWQVAIKVTGSSLSGTATSAVAGVTIEFSATRTTVGGAPAAPAAPAKAEEKPAEAAKGVTIDFDGFERRALRLPVRNGAFGHTAVNDAGALIYVRNPVAGEGAPTIQIFSITDESRQERAITAASDFALSANGKKLVAGSPAGFAIFDASAGASPAPISLRGMTVTIDPRAEWHQIFVEAWRLYRDYLYDRTMQGVNWAAVRKQYEPMIEDCSSRQDLNYILSELVGELNVSHARVEAGGDATDAPMIPVGLLGADFALENGAYRIKKIYEGAPWDLDARGPLSQPGVNVKEGDYLLSVNRQPVDTTKDPYAAFQGLAGRTITITVSDKPTRDDSAREVVVVPLGDDHALRYRAEIEKNRAYVEQQTGGRVGYIYVPDEVDTGASDLFRQFVGEFGKDALIVDERWNTGGYSPDRFIELLNRPALFHWANAWGREDTTPYFAQQGPKCMLINSSAGSSGDLFPFSFRKAGLGKLIGTRTWGGVVGLSGAPAFVDGGAVAIPRHAFFTTENAWGIEGHGVDPDIEVIDDPALLAKGQDPQLDAAIKYIADELRRNPPSKPKRPAPANRSGMSGG